MFVFEFLYFFVKEFLTRSVVEYFSRTIIEIIDHDLYLIFRNFVKVGSLRKKSSNHSISVFIGSTLPRFVRFGEKYRYSDLCCYLFVIGMFCAIVPSCGFYRIFWKFGENTDRCIFYIFRRFFIYFLCEYKSCFSFHFCVNCGKSCADWQYWISFEMSKFFTCFGSWE